METVFVFVQQHMLIFGALAAVLFFAIISLWVNVNHSPPPLVINEEGIFDRRLGVGVIRWEDIESAQIEANYGHRYVCLKVRSEDRYLSQLQGEKRERVEDSRDMGFKHFNIDVQGVNMSLLDLLKLIKKKKAQYGIRD